MEALFGSEDTSLGSCVQMMGFQLSKLRVRWRSFVVLVTGLSLALVALLLVWGKFLVAAFVPAGLALLLAWRRGDRSRVRNLLQVTSSELVDTGSRLSQSAEALSETGQSLVDRAALGEERTRSIREFSDRLILRADSHSSEIDSAMRSASQAESNARVGAEEALELARLVRDLRETASHVQEMTRKMQGVALQTRLLALNASIEAARAGKAGAGFSIVADEVRNLAQSATDYAAQAESALLGVEERWERADEAAQSLADRCGEVAGRVEDSSRLAQNVSESAQQEKVEIARIAESANELHQLIQGTREQADDCWSCCDRIRSGVSELRTSILRILRDGRSGTGFEAELSARVKHLSGSAVPEDVFLYNVSVNLPLIAMAAGEPQITRWYEFPGLSASAAEPAQVLTVLLRVHDAIADSTGSGHYVGKTREVRPSEVIAVSAAITDLLKAQEIQPDRNEGQRLESEFQAWRSKLGREVKPSDCLLLAQFLESTIERAMRETGVAIAAS
ncbi:MAG: methyl-accepting chemotaxis protein [Planctomycetota bacterium]